MALGLEFDGVVVVEPGSFPENLGREGQWYTSLTRAKREFIVSGAATCLMPCVRQGGSGFCGSAEESVQGLAQ
jgi:hypothetical protein